MKRSHGRNFGEWDTFLSVRGPGRVGCMRNVFACCNGSALVVELTERLVPAADSESGWPYDARPPVPTSQAVTPPTGFAVSAKLTVTMKPRV